MIWFLSIVSFLCFVIGLLYILNKQPSNGVERIYFLHNQSIGMKFFAISAALLIAIYVKG